MARIIMLLGIPLFTWTGVACFVGIWRFRYPPLAILGTGYLSFVASFVMLTGIAGAPEAHPVLLGVLFLVGILGIFGYRLTYYSKMKGGQYHSETALWLRRKQVSR